MDLTRRPSDIWIVDFGTDMPEADAALFEQPFAHVTASVRPARAEVQNASERDRWWLHARAAPELRRVVAVLPRFIVSPRLAKHRLFAWLAPPVVVDGQWVVTAHADDATFGILHSWFHELWSLRLGISVEDRPATPPPPASRPCHFGRNRGRSLRLARPGGRFARRRHPAPAAGAEPAALRGLTHCP